MKEAIGRKTAVRIKPSPLPSDVWLDVFAFLSRDQIDSSSISCSIFMIVIGQYPVSCCLRHLQEVHIKAYDANGYVPLAKIIPASGSAKYSDEDEDIVELLQTTLMNCYIETFKVEYTQSLPPLIPELAYSLDKSVHVGRLHFTNSHLYVLPTLKFLAFFNRLASITAVRFDDALAAEQMSNELLAICSKKGVKELRCTPMAPFPASRHSMHELNEDGIIAFLLGDTERTTPKRLAVGCVALGPDFINRIVEIHESTGVTANIVLDVMQPYDLLQHLDVSRWEQYRRSVPFNHGAVFDFPGPIRLQVAVLGDVLRIRRGSTENNDGFFFSYESSVSSNADNLHSMF